MGDLEEDKKTIVKSAHHYFQAARWDDAIAEYEKLLRLDPDDMNIRNMLGDLYVKKNDPVKAFEEYAQVAGDLSQRGQTDKIPLIHKKIAQLDREKLGPAARKKHGLILLFVKADKALAENEWEGAAAVFHEILEQDPEDPTAALKLAELDEKLGRISGAVERYTRLGETFLKNRLFKKAQEMFKKIVALDPENLPARRLVAQTYVKLGSENEAKKEYLNIAEQALARKDLDGAYEYAKAAVELKSIEAHYLVGVVLFERQKWADAKASFEHLLRFKPNHLAAQVFLGKIHAAMNDPAKAAEAFQKAFALEEDNVFALEAWADYCVKKNDKGGAVQAFTRLIDRAWADNYREGAVKWARALVSADPNLAGSQLKLAEALEKNGDPRGAADIYYHLALAAGRLNKAEDAARYIQKTLGLHPTHEGALAQPARKGPEKTEPVALKTAASAPPPAPVPPVDPLEAFKAQMSLADHCLEKGLLDEAADIYQRLINAHPDRPEAKEKLNRVYAAYAKTGELKTPPLTKAPEVSPGEAALKNLREMETKAREEAQAKAEGEKKAREEAEKKAREEAEKKIREEMEKKAREEAERKSREEAEKKIQAEIERRVREEVEKRIREEREKKIREEAEKKIREEMEKRAREEAERKAREEAEKKIRAEVEKRMREEAESQSINEIQRKIREAVEKKTREVAEKKAREEAENRERLELERKVREEVERKVKEEMEKKAREEAERKIRENVERQVREQGEQTIRAEVERRIQEELEKKYREDEKRRIREDAKRKIRETMNKRTEVLGVATALTEADRLQSQGRHSEAVKLYEKILESNPGDPVVQEKLGAVRAILRQREAAAAGPPTLRVIESPPKEAGPPAQAPVPPDKPNDSGGQRKNDKIGYV